MQSWIAVHQGFGQRLAILERATNIDRVWARNDAGGGLFSLPLGDSQQRLIGSGYLYVVENDVGLPPWVGYIAPDQLVIQNAEQGLTEVPLREASWMLDRLFTLPEEPYVSRASGSILQSAAQLALAQAPLPVRIAPVEDGGPATSWIWRRSSIFAVAQQLAESVNYQWWADYEVTSTQIGMVLRWASRRGVDLTTRVQLWEGRHFAEPSASFPSATLPHGVQVVGTSAPGTAYADRPAFTKSAAAVSSGPSLDPFGLQQVEHNEQVADQNTAEQLALARLLATSRPQVRLLINGSVSWPDLFLDNDVTLYVPSLGLRAPLFGVRARVAILQPDEWAGEADLVLEVLDGPDARAAT